MIKSVFIIFIPVDQYGHDDFNRNRIIYDSGYIKSIDVIKIGRRWVYRLYRDTGIAIYLNTKQYRFTLGVNKL